MSKEIQTTTQRQSLLRSIAAQWGVPEIEPTKLYETLKATAFKGKKNGDSYIAVTDEQFMALSIVSKQYKLNPFLKEIYAYPDKQGGIVPVVGVDGWANIINAHPQMDGMEYRYSENMVTIGKSKLCHEWVECIITRKDRTKPIVVREYLDECYNEPSFPTPWQTHTKRFLRHKATIQCGRMAFGFGGIYDEDEAGNIMKDVTPVVTVSQKTSDINDLINTMVNTQTETYNKDTGEILTEKPTDPLNASINAAMEAQGDLLQQSPDQVNVFSPVSLGSKRNTKELVDRARIITGHLQGMQPEFRSDYINEYDPGLIQDLNNAGQGPVATKIKAFLV